MRSRRPLNDASRRNAILLGSALCAAFFCSSSVSAADTIVCLEFLDSVPGAGQVVRPCVSIDESGLVRWSEPGEGESREARLSSVQQAELIQELTETLDVDSLDTEALWRDIVSEGRRVGLSPQIHGAGVTRITVSLPAEGESPRIETVVECPACQLLATRYPAVESLQRFARSQRLLENLRAIMQIGGFEEAERLTEHANAHLAGQGQDGDPLTCRDLAFVRSLPEGTMIATFHRAPPAECQLTLTVEPGRPPMFQFTE
jgi:hypothetical protein